MTGIIQQQTAKNEVAKTKKNNSLQNYIKLYEHQIQQALPNVLTTERFMRMVTNAIKQTPKLAECTPESFLGCMLTTAQLGLEPNTPLGQAYLIPYTRKGVLQCELQIGYKGLIDLAYRSGELINIESRVVYSNDTFEMELGLNPVLKHIPTDANKGEPIWVYAIYRLKNGGSAFEVMSVDSIKEHAQKFSKSFNSSVSPWVTDFESMAKKTVIKKLLKYAPLKSEIQLANSVDETTNNANITDENEIVVVTDYANEDETLKEGTDKGE